MFVILKENSGRYYGPGDLSPGSDDVHRVSQIGFN